MKAVSDNQRIMNHKNDLLSSRITNEVTQSNRTITKMPSQVTIERCCFILIHLLLYVIILTVVYIKLEQVIKKQEAMVSILNSNVNITFNKDLRQDLNSYQHVPKFENNLGCLCQTVSFRRQNRTVRCLKLRVGLTDTIENVLCEDNLYSQWLVVLNRQTDSIDFNRTWIEYRRGFGNTKNGKDFWIGNQNLHRLTNVYSCRLKIQLTDWYNETRTAVYETFRVGNQHSGYRLRIDEYHGDMEESNRFDNFSSYHNNARFSTYDRYATNTNCPQKHGGGGWWYHSGVQCAHVNLNGQFTTHSDGLTPYNTGIIWIGWKPDRHYSFQRVNMAIQIKSY